MKLKLGALLLSPFPALNGTQELRKKLSSNKNRYLKKKKRIKRNSKRNLPTIKPDNVQTAAAKNQSKTVNHLYVKRLQIHHHSNFHENVGNDALVNIRNNVNLFLNNHKENQKFFAAHTRITQNLEITGSQLTYTPYSINTHLQQYRPTSWLLHPG